MVDCNKKNGLLNDEFPVFGHANEHEWSSKEWKQEELLVSIRRYAANLCKMKPKAITTANHKETYAFTRRKAISELCIWLVKY